MSSAQEKQNETRRTTSKTGVRTEVRRDLNPPTRPTPVYSSVSVHESKSRRTGIRRCRVDEEGTRGWTHPSPDVPAGDPHRVVRVLGVVLPVRSPVTVVGLLRGPHGLP